MKVAMNVLTEMNNEMHKWTSSKEMNESMNQINLTVINAWIHEQNDLIKQCMNKKAVNEWTEYSSMDIDEQWTQFIGLVNEFTCLLRSTWMNAWLSKQMWI